MPHQRLSTNGDVDIRRQGLREVARAIGRLGLHGSGRRRGRRTGVDRVGIAAAVEQEVLVLHIRKAFGIEGHAHEVEVRIEAVNLDRILNVVGCRTIAVVVGIRVRLARPGIDGLVHAVARRSNGSAQNVVIGIADSAEINRLSSHLPVLQLKRRAETAAHRHAVLTRTNVDLAHHAHLQVLGRRDVAVPEVSPGIGRQVVVSEAAADVDRHRGVGHAVVEG